MKLNVKFIIRGVLVGMLPVVVAMVGGWLWLQQFLVDPPFGPTPLPVTPAAPAGALPAGAVGLQQWVQHRGEDYRLVGSGFLLQLPSGAVIGVTTAHSTAIGSRTYPLEHVALKIAAEDDFLADTHTFYGLPGHARRGEDARNDYVLLQLPAPVNVRHVLLADPRGLPQVGERVTLFSGLGGENGERRPLTASVQKVEDQIVWIAMDALFDPGRMSGSPVVSQHTGQVVGMAVAAGARDGQLLIALNPIGAIVAHAEAAATFPAMAEYWR